MGAGSMNDFAPLSRQQLSDKDFARLRVALVQAKMQFNLLAQSAAQHDDYISELIYLLRVKELDDADAVLMHWLDPQLYPAELPVDPVREARLQYLERRIAEVPF